jgi:hypothetical protein
MLIFAASAAALVWSEFGRAYVRRRFFGVPPISPAARTESGFMALLMPRIARNGNKSAMSVSELNDFLDGVRAAGYATIGLQDVRDFYAKTRLLPPKALLLAYAEEDPLGVQLTDGAMRDHRFRGALFITGEGITSAASERRLLTRHDMNQMREGGAWEFGEVSSGVLSDALRPGEIFAVLNEDSRRPAAGTFPVRFTASDVAYNDERDSPVELHILSVRPGRPVSENLRILAGAWPREAAFTDDFAADGLGIDWITGWGTVSAGHRRLALLPTPRQTGAGVFLRGTERWRDLALEFDLKRYSREFWAYVRYKDDGGYLRVGVRNGFWVVEQKIGPMSLPTMLARAPVAEGSLPAHVRLVLKDGSAIVHVNGRMMFGRALRVSPAVDRGRVLLGVYDVRQKSALALLTFVRAAPLSGQWITWKRASSAALEDKDLDLFREEAVFSRAISPLWVKAAPDGSVAVAETQGGLLRSLAGFYGCRLIPTALLPPSEAALLARPAETEKLLSGLIGAADGLDAAGLNLRLRSSTLARPETRRFLARLRSELRGRRRELWVTVDGAGAAPEGALAADGVLRPARESPAEIEILEPARSRPVSRPQWETAFNP